MFNYFENEEDEVALEYLESSVDLDEERQIHGTVSSECLSLTNARYNQLESSSHKESGGKMFESAMQIRVNSFE